MSNTTEIDYFDDLPPQQSAESTLETLVALCNESHALDDQIAQAEVALNELKGRQDKILMERIPSVMEELGMEKFTLQDGRKVETKNDIKCNLSAERKPQGLAWVREHNFGGIIKTAVSLAFGKGEEKEAMKAMETLRSVGFMPAIEEGIHPSTLKSFVKERLEAGDKLPLDVFGVYEFKMAKIVAPKTKK